MGDIYYYIDLYYLREVRKLFKRKPEWELKEIVAISEKARKLAEQYIFGTPSKS